MAYQLITTKSQQTETYELYVDALLRAKDLLKEWVTESQASSTGAIFLRNNAGHTLAIIKPLK